MFWISPWSFTFRFRLGLCQDSKWLRVLKKFRNNTKSFRRNYEPLQSVLLQFVCLFVCLSGYHVLFDSHELSCPWSSVFPYVLTFNLFEDVKWEMCCSENWMCQSFCYSRGGLETSSGTFQTISGQLPEFEETRFKSPITMQLFSLDGAHSMLSLVCLESLSISTITCLKCPGHKYSCLKIRNLWLLVIGKAPFETPFFSVFMLS